MTARIRRVGRFAAATGLFGVLVPLIVVASTLAPIRHFSIAAEPVAAEPVVAEPVWQTPLSEAGQSDVCLHGEHLYLTVHAPISQPLRAGFSYSDTIVGQCFERRTGQLLWELPLPGTFAGKVLESWHDATSLAPVANDDCVVFHNLNGCLACCDLSGRQRWRRTWQAPDPDIKNCRMFLHGELLIVALPSERIAVPGNEKHPDLPFYQLHGIDLRTGEERWISPVLLTHATQYALDRWKEQPVLVASMIDLSHWKFGQGRRGYLISLENGEPIRSFELPPAIPHQKNQLCRGKFVVTVSAGPRTEFQLVDPENGQVTDRFSMERPDRYFAWSDESNGYREAPFAAKFRQPTLRNKGFPTPSTVHVVGDHIYFWRYDTSAIGCLDVANRQWVLIEAPIQALAGRTVWDSKSFQFTKGIANAAGQVVNMRVGTPRGIQSGGFGHTNPPWPTRLGQQLFWQAGAGMLFEIDTDKPFSPASIRWHSLDAKLQTGQSWTFGAPAVDATHIYIRSQRALVCLRRT
ncbi:MAG: PQQ-binding-like beta-propeller repeat protein [Planctomycetales bacterium]|nr:PQQ-binding-like beta-propeller repeat protein [Planctomycetales bacterium]